MKSVSQTAKERLDSINWGASYILSDYSILAVSTRPPAGDLSRCTLYCLGPAGLCPPYLSRLALQFSRPLRASVRWHHMTLTLTITLPGSTWVPMPSLVLIGPAVRPAITRIHTDTHIALSYVDLLVLYVFSLHYNCLCAGGIWFARLLNDKIAPAAVIMCMWCECQF